MTKQLRVYRARSGQLQEIVLYAAHVAASSDINVLQMSRFELVLGQNVFGRDAERARGLDEQHHFVSFDFSPHELRHFESVCRGAREVRGSKKRDQCRRRKTIALFVNYANQGDVRGGPAPFLKRQRTLWRVHVSARPSKSPGGPSVAL